MNILAIINILNHRKQLLIMFVVIAIFDTSIFADTTGNLLIQKSSGPAALFTLKQDFRSSCPTTRGRIGITIFWINGAKQILGMIGNVSSNGWMDMTGLTSPL